MLVEPNGSRKIKVDGPTEFSLKLENQWGSTGYFDSVLAVPFSDYTLSQNYPNPFNPSTTIEFNLPILTKVTINVYNILGRKLTTLADEFFPAGLNRIKWKASDFASGIYFLRLSVGANSYTRKLLLLK
jgi:hypothetical protein